jgi:hypothetical protein
VYRLKYTLFFRQEGDFIMAKRKKKVSAYTRNRNRINSYIRRLNKQGLITDLYIPTEKMMRNQGVKGAELTKLTLELKALTSEKLRAIAVQVHIQEVDNIMETGFASLEVEGFKRSISVFPKEIADKVISLIDKMIVEQGIEDVAIALENIPYQLHEYLNRNKYDSSSALEEFASALIEYLPDASDQYKRDLMDAFEYNELGYTIED